MRISMLYSGEQILSLKSCLVFYAGDSLMFKIWKSCSYRHIDNCIIDIRGTVKMFVDNFNNLQTIWHNLVKLTDIIPWYFWNKSIKKYFYKCYWIVYIYKLVCFVLVCLCWSLTAQSTTRSCRASQLIVALFLGRLRPSKRLTSNKRRRPRR